MFMEEPEAIVATLAELAAPRAIVSIVIKNARRLTARKEPVQQLGRVYASSLTDGRSSCLLEAPATPSPLSRGQPTLPVF